MRRVFFWEIIDAKHSDTIIFKPFSLRISLMRLLLLAQRVDAQSFELAESSHIHCLS